MILDEILAHKREEVRRAMEARSLSDLERACGRAAPARDFAAALRRGPKDPIRLIAEFKRASPSKGIIRPDLMPADVARRYSAGGASAMSVLTDRKFFSGDLQDLEEVRRAVNLPLLRKDFIIDPWQISEARAAGADAILLIAAALKRDDMTAFQRRAKELGMASLIEVHDEGDLEKALSIHAEIIGVNNRDLRTFRVDVETTFRLRARIPAGLIVVSESGIGTREDVLRLQSANVDAILVGESLMKRHDPGAATADLLGRSYTQA